MQHYIGIDIGSTSAKTAVIDDEKRLLHSFVQPTGWSSAEAARSIGERLDGLGIFGAPCVATGYGRISVPFADRCVTEITCHALGACHIHGSGDLTVIDIGGQDTKIIEVRGGAVHDFVMNDKCSAGTGRFLEVMANTLGMDPSALCALAEQGGGTQISSMCTVFAESEVISLIGRGEKKENIAFGVVDSIIAKVVAQAGRLSPPSGNMLCLTGGLSECDYVRSALEKALGQRVEAKPEGRYAGAIGAALFARKTNEKQGGVL